MEESNPYTESSGGNNEVTEKEQLDINNQTASVDKSE